MGSQSQSLLFFIIDTSYSCVFELYVVSTLPVLLEYLLIDINELYYSYIVGFWWENLRERDHWGEPDVDERIILRRIFRK
jgi:uncharacterized membrane protein